MRLEKVWEKRNVCKGYYYVREKRNVCKGYEVWGSAFLRSDILHIGFKNSNESIIIFDELFVFVFCETSRKKQSNLCIFRIGGGGGLGKKLLLPHSSTHSFPHSSTLFPHPDILSPRHTPHTSTPLPLQNISTTPKM